MCSVHPITTVSPYCFVCTSTVLMMHGQWCSVIINVNPIAPSISQNLFFLIKKEINNFVTIQIVIEVAPDH